MPGPATTPGREKTKDQGLDVRGRWADVSTKAGRMEGAETAGRGC